MNLKWEPYGDSGLTAKGDKGTWRIVTDAGAWWHLTLQPPWTRGMLNRGKFIDSHRAAEFAQEREDGVEIFPAQIEASEL